MQNLKSLPSTAKKEISLEEIWLSGRMPFTVICLLGGFYETWKQRNIYGSRMINVFPAAALMFYTLDCNRLIGSRSSELSNSQSSQLLTVFPVGIDELTLSFHAFHHSERAFVGSGSLPELPLVQHGPFELLQDEKLDQCEAVMMTEDNIIFVEPVCYVGF